MKEAHESQLAWLVSSSTELSNRLKAEAATHQGALEKLHQLFNQTQVFCQSA